MSSVSVIVPVYKVEEYLPRCIDSILCQTFTDFDLVLINDGSPDGSGKICDEYAKKDKRVVVLHQENKGAAVARNNGIEYALDNCTSKWLSFVDSDDWIASNYLEVLMNAVQKSKCSVVICGFEKKEETGNFKEEQQAGRIAQAEDYIFENDIRAIVPWGKLYDKNLWHEIRYPEGRICEDEFVTYKVLLKSGLLYITDEVLYAYFQNPQSVMNDRWSLKRLDGVDAHCERYEYFLKHYPNLTDQSLVQIWKDCRYQGQMALLNANEEDKNKTLAYLNKVMKDYKLPWKSIFRQGLKEAIWLILQKVDLKVTCVIRNTISIGL